MISISTTRKISAEEFHEVLSASGIQRPTQDLQRLKRMLSNANVLVTAWQNQELIGILRGITDGAFCTFISDIAVKRELQRQGIGKKLITALRTEQGKQISTLLLSAPEAMLFYPKIGFEQVPTGFRLRREY